MRKTYMNLTLVIIFVFVFSSCSDNNDLLLQIDNESNRTYFQTEMPNIEMIDWKNENITESMMDFGKLLFINHNEKKIFTYDIKRKSVFPLDTVNSFSNNLSVSISPYDSSIVFIDNNRLICINSNGNKQISLPEDNLYISKFLFDGTLLLFRDRNIQLADGIKKDGGNDYLYIYSPIDDTFIKKSVFLPNLSLGLHNYFQIEYSDDLRYVIYRSNINNENNNIQFSLLNIEKGEVIWISTNNANNLFGSNDSLVPTWNNMTNSFIYLFSDNLNNANGLYSIDPHANITKIVNFDDLQIIPWGNGFISKINLSPCGRYILFQTINQKTGNFQQFYIFDITENKIFSIDFPDEIIKDSMFDSIWAPGESSFYIGFIYNNINSSSQIMIHNYLVDIDNKIKFQMDSNEVNSPFLKNQLVGWIN